MLCLPQEIIDGDLTERILWLCVLTPQNAVSSSVWASVSGGGGSTWASDTSSIWGDSPNSNVGFWDEAVKEAAPPPTRKATSQKNKGNANLRYSHRPVLTHTQAALSCITCVCVCVCGEDSPSGR